MPRRLLTALPVYNEVEHVRPVLDEVRRHCPHVLVVDDGSTDGTDELLASLPGIRVVRHASNRGYGAALRTAFDHAVENDYDALVTIDCDGQHEPGLIPTIADRLDAPEDPVDVVSGSRYLEIFPGDSTPPEDRRRINRDVTALLNDRLGMELTDSFCGFKAYRTSALRKLDLTEPGYGVPLQFWVQAVDAGLRIAEFPVPLVYLEEDRSFGGSLDDASRRMAYYLSILERELAASHCCSDAADGLGESLS